MIISKIVTQNYIYFNLHAEEVIYSNYINDDKSGIYGDRLQIPTINRIIEEIERSDTQIMNIVLDFKFINACQPNLNRPIIQLKNKGYKILLIDISKKLCEELSFDTIGNLSNISQGDIFSKFFLFENEIENFTNIEIKPADIFYEKFKSTIKEYINPHSVPHTSSFVYLTSYVDMKKFMSHENKLLLFSLYKLAIKIKTEWHREIEYEPILICQSMNSAYIVSILSTFLKLDILIFDKIGPVNKLYNRLDNTISDKRKYIVVSDLVCLGTEVKIVKSLIQFIGGNCLGNVSIIKTETLRKDHIKKENATIAVFSIRKENNRELKYDITTDLETLSNE